jgi:hypothetical protein
MPGMLIDVRNLSPDQEFPTGGKPRTDIGKGGVGGEMGAVVYLH